MPKQENMTHNLRSNSGASHMYEQSLARTVIFKNSFLYDGVELWNKLPVSVKNANDINMFKHLCKLHV